MKYPDMLFLNTYLYNSWFIVLARLCFSTLQVFLALLFAFANVFVIEYDTTRKEARAFITALELIVYQL